MEGLRRATGILKEKVKDKKRQMCICLQISKVIVSVWGHDRVVSKLKVTTQWTLGKQQIFSNP